MYIYTSPKLTLGFGLVSEETVVNQASANRLVKAQPLATSSECFCEAIPHHGNRRSPVHEVRRLAAGPRKAIVPKIDGNCSEETQVRESLMTLCSAGLEKLVPPQR